MKWKLKKRFMLLDGISTFIAEKPYTITLIQRSSEDPQFYSTHQYSYPCFRRIWILAVTVVSP